MLVNDNSMYIYLVLAVFLVAIIWYCWNLNHQTFFDKCFIINLEKTSIGQRRWKRIKSTAPFDRFGERFPGVDGKAKKSFAQEISANILRDKWDHGLWQSKQQSHMVPMSQGEMGIIMSHYGIWKQMLKKEIGSVLVLEDDASKVAPDFMEKVYETMRNIPADWDIVLFGFWCHDNEKMGKKVNDKIWKVESFVLMHCYLINMKGARKLMGMLPIDKPLDTWLSSKSDEINIYRHNYLSKNRSSRLIRQALVDKHNVNTNVVVG